mgnify:CR=1
LFGLLISACGEKTEESGGQTSSESSTLGFAKNQQGQIKIAVLGTSDFFPDRAVLQRMGLPEDLAARIIEHLQKS